MNKLQKYFILHTTRFDHMSLIGTKSGQAFVKGSAEKNLALLKAKEKGKGFYELIEVTPVDDVLT